MEQRIIFIKFGEREHLERLRLEGEIFCRSAHAFREIEDGGVRGDPLEGVIFHYQANRVNITMNTSIGEEINLTNSLVGQVTMTGMGNENFNIFSLYGCKAVPGRYIFDSRVSAFGRHCIVFTNTQEFIDRVKIGAATGGLWCNYAMVDYFAKEERHGRISVFDKQKLYEYQSEFRFAFSPGTAEPIILKLGSLIDITTEVISTVDLANDFILEWDVAAKEAILNIREY